MIDKITNNGFFNRIHQVRKAMSTQMKVTILMAVGFTIVFGAVGTFIDRQFREVVYSNPIMRVKQPFDTNQANLLNNGENVVSNTYLKSEKLFIPKEDRVYIKYFNQGWYMFYKHGTMVSYQNISIEHDMVERFSSRLLLIMGTSEVLLLLMAFILARANMIPITRALRQQRRFVADAAHEFKTPMTVIQNKLETMLEHPNDSVMDQVENVANSLTEVRHLNKLTADMLKLAQADAEVVMFDFQPTDLVKISKEVSEILEVQFNEKQQILNLEMPDELIIEGDAQRLRQLILNLVDNAHKYTDSKTVITVQLRKLRNIARIKIIDNGEGISTEDKKHLFDRFYRVDKSRSRASGGHGLGLSIVQWIVEGHGGKISVEDTVPHGTTFDIVLPLRHRKQPDK
ncbi:HAMP domain-containing histidine kinase [Weissella coleopterorum]|uniref:histidine kinase n=1 Tax=Weissella coleopterorum TaxID=2714949 RepID=A0A6G8AYI4_9LACO|nr:HAMP domain-containing sensor histidine kinase [Weissella coleopterorum]QIL49943.1 HAMP domain-containing histidine kinase [Weissella coleopterorum]